MDDIGLEARRRGDSILTARELRQVRDLWRGRPCSGLELNGWVRARVTALEEQRLEVLGALAEAMLAQGECTGAASDLRELVAEEPYHEKFRAQLMLALCWSGRRAEALEVYRDAWKRFAIDLGMEPGPELQRLKEQILTSNLVSGQPRAPETTTST